MLLYIAFIYFYYLICFYFWGKPSSTLSLFLALHSEIIPRGIGENYMVPKVILGSVVCKEGALQALCLLQLYCAFINKNKMNYTDSCN